MPTTTAWTTNGTRNVPPKMNAPMRRRLSSRGGLPRIGRKNAAATAACTNWPANWTNIIDAGTCGLSTAVSCACVGSSAAAYSHQRRAGAISSAASRIPCGSQISVGPPGTNRSSIPIAPPA